MELRCSNRDCAREGAIVQKELGANYTDFLNVEVSNVILGTGWGPGKFLDIIHMPTPASKALPKSALQSRSLSPLVGFQNVLEFCGIAIS